MFSVRADECFLVVRVRNETACSVRFHLRGLFSFYATHSEIYPWTKTKEIPKRCGLLGFLAELCCGLFLKNMTRSAKKKLRTFLGVIGQK